LTDGDVQLPIKVCKFLRIVLSSFRSGNGGWYILKIYPHEVLSILRAPGGDVEEVAENILGARVCRYIPPTPPNWVT